MSPWRSLPITSENVCSGCSSVRRRTVRRVKLRPPISPSTALTRTRGRSAAAASSHIDRRSANGASGLPNACSYAGTNHTSSTGAVSRTYSATIWCATWGGLKLPPNKATRTATLRILRHQRGLPQLGERAFERHEGRFDVGQRRAGVDGGADLRAPGEQIDRGRIGHELVRLGPPPEVVAAQLARRRDQRDAHPVGPKRRRVDDVQLHAAARMASELVERR